MTNRIESGNICILGCAGFIGSHLVGHLLSDTDYTITGLDIVSEKIDQYLINPSFFFAKVNVCDTKKVRYYVEQCDTVISLAALCNPSLYNTVPLEVIDINFIQPLELVKMCSEMGKRLIHFSSSEVYGKTVQGIAGDNLKNPENPSDYILSEDHTPLIMGPVSAQRWSYASAKQLLERVIYAYGEEGKLEYTIIRPFNFIGPRMDFIPGIDGEGIPRVFACFMEALLLGKPLKLVDDGRNRRAFTGIDDAVDAIMRIITQPDKVKNQIVNIGNPDNEVTIRKLAEMMVSIYRELYPQENSELKIISVSSDEFYGKGYEDSDRRVPDISKVKQLLGWEPTTDLKDVVERTMISYIEYYRVVQNEENLNNCHPEQSTRLTGGNSARRMLL